jgi:hypothetical protein
MTRQTAASVASSPNVHTGKRQALAWNSFYSMSVT